VLAAAALAVSLARPPAAYLVTGRGRVPLAISSWCWAARCGAPIAASRRVAVAPRGTTVRIQLAFAPTQVRLEIGGVAVKPSLRGVDLTWRVNRGGGISLTATGVRGFVTYVGRLAVPRGSP
jgi:hypothetical protein